MQGIRRDYDDDSIPNAGEYGKQHGQWYGVPPAPADLHANLSNHQVVEHEDGTITVSPSILVSLTYPDQHWEWHGYLERGVWREV